jgi:hypothetical protein
VKFFIFQKGLRWQGRLSRFCKAPLLFLLTIWGQRVGFLEIFLFFMWGRSVNRFYPADICKDPFIGFVTNDGEWNKI